MELFAVGSALLYLIVIKSFFSFFAILNNNNCYNYLGGSGVFSAKCIRVRLGRVAQRARFRLVLRIDCAQNL